MSILLITFLTYNAFATSSSRDHESKSDTPAAVQRMNSFSTASSWENEQYHVLNREELNAISPGISLKPRRQKAQGDPKIWGYNSDDDKPRLPQPEAGPGVPRGTSLNLEVDKRNIKEENQKGEIQKDQRVSIAFEKRSSFYLKSFSIVCGIGLLLYISFYIYDFKNDWSDNLAYSEL